MKHLEFRISHFRSSQGMALVIVLAIIILVLGLCVGFLARVSTERGSSKGYASAVDARLLAESAVQIVQGQIDAATTQGTRVSWSSQPGLIRTYDDSGNPVKSYKLYSSATMQTPGALNPATEVEALAEWFDSPALYTDMNAPVDARFSGTPDTWPILDPSSLAAGAANPPQGFGISGAPTGDYQGVTNSAPMPVQWVYVLQGGQIVAPTGSGKTAAVAGASSSNPIVGRIAFWTDDETCKVNINTASEGTYWDIPKANTNQDAKMALCQPAQNEFQAFPGHPATTSLSAVFPGLDPRSGTTLDQGRLGQLFGIVPRLQNGGSMGGSATATSAVALDADRLYPTGDELLFSPASAVPRSVNPGMDKTLLGQTGFFLTTSSRAPETNLFNLPKIACWPISAIDDSNHRSAFDRLIAFCATLNGQPYYFQRRNSHSATEDYEQIDRNKTLYAYLQNLMARNVPGFGGNLATKFGGDADQVLTEIFDYIRITNLWDGNLAGSTASSPQYTYTEGKDGAPTTTALLPGHGQVVPIVIPTASGSTQGFGRFNTITEAGIQLICTADATDTTLSSNDPATNLTLATDTPLQKDDAAKTKQIRIEAMVLLEPFCPMHGFEGARPDLEIKIEGLEDWTIQGDKDATPVNLGFPSLAAQTEAGAGIFRLREQKSGGSTFAGPWGIQFPLIGHGIRARNGGRLAQDAGFTDSSNDDGIKDRQYPFVSEPVTITVGGTTPKASSQMIFSGGPVKIHVYDRASGTLVQTLNINFSGGTFPSPILFTSTSVDKSRWTFQASGCVSGYKGRMETFDSDFNPFLKKGTLGNDVVRSMAVSTSSGTNSWDFRLLAATPSVSGAHFSKHPDFDATSNSLASSFYLMNYGAAPYYGTVKGKLANVTYLAARQPYLTFDAPQAIATGDWDNGIGYVQDGAYLNKPDEGNAPSSSAPSTPPYLGSINAGAGVFGKLFTSPNRVMPSPAMFGSLPVGVKRDLGWQTLLFRRQPGHPDYGVANGLFTSDPDYLLLDLFWMPVVQPYAISEPLSTAGKINLNQQIIPFAYITRNTGLYAVLKNEKVMAIPSADGEIYKTTINSGADHLNSEYRRSIDIPATLQQCQFRYDDSDGSGLHAFRSPAEICDMHIVPDNANVTLPGSKASLDAEMAAYWGQNALTGDNSRERPYVTIYPRLTTKSNTFTVHFRAQALKQAPGATIGQWTEGKDLVTADYRGSTIIERFIDPNDPAMPANLDYASNPDASPTLDSFYHWRVRSHHQFAP